MPIETRAKDVVSGWAENEVGRGDSAGSCAPRERADGEQLEGDAARRLALSLGASTVGSLFRTSEEQPGSVESAGRCGLGSRFPVGLLGRQPRTARVRVARWLQARPLLPGPAAAAAPGLHEPLDPAACDTSRRGCPAPAGPVPVPSADTPRLL